MHTEFRSLAVPATAGQRKGRPMIVGYAAVFNSLSEEMRAGSKTFKEIIRPGAFAASLAEARAGRLDVIARYEHLDLVGRMANGTLRLREDSHGLRYEIEPADTTIGRDLVALVRRGDIRGASFEFRARPNGDSWRRDSDGTIIRELLAVDLRDVSPTSRPAYEATTARLSGGPYDNLYRRLELAEMV